MWILLYINNISILKTNQNYRLEKKKVLQAAYGPQTFSFQPLVSVERFHVSCLGGNTKDDKSSIMLGSGKMGKFAFIPLLPVLASLIRCKMLPCCPLAVQHLLPWYPACISFFGGSSKTTLLVSPPPFRSALLPASFTLGSPSVLCARQRQTLPGYHTAK